MAENLKEKPKPKVRHNNDCGLDYLTGPTNVLFENGVLVSREDYKKWDDEHTLVQHLEYLADDPEANNYDYAYAMTTGTLRKRKGTADLVASARTEKRREKEVKKVKEITGEEQKKEFMHSYVLSSAFITEMVMIIVGLGSAVMSAYHTRVFLMESKPAGVSTMIALMFIMFSATAFTASRYFFNMAGLTKLFGIIFLATGLAVVSFSMFSTITVSYNQYVRASARSEEKQDIININRLLLESNRKEREAVQHEIERYEQEIDYYRTQSWRRADSLQDLLTAAYQRLSVLRTEEADIIRETPQAILEESTEQETVYTFMAGIFNMPVDLIRFLVYVIPAIFFDVISPFALSVVLLLEDNRRKIVSVI
jgi:hypothetical protein